MLQSVWDDIRREFSFGNMVNRLIIVNVAVFLVVNILWMMFSIANGHTESEGFRSLIRFISGSSDWWHMVTHPWALFTHMFLHESFFHILWNMLYLFWFGRIFGDLLGDRRVLPLYLLGGLAGFAAYFIGYNLLDFVAGGTYIMGASGAIFAILVAAGLFAPEYGIRLLFLGTIRLKYIVLFAIFVQIIGLGSANNFGGTLDHIGGIIMGFLFAFYLKRGTDLTEPIQRLLDWITNSWNNLLTPSKAHPKPGPRAAYRGGRSVRETTAPKSRPSFMKRAGGTAGKAQSSGKTDAGPQLTHQEELDAILDKIKEKGYNSLSKDEKDFLFRASNQ